MQRGSFKSTIRNEKQPSYTYQCRRGSISPFVKTLKYANFSTFFLARITSASLGVTTIATRGEQHRPLGPSLGSFEENVTAYFYPYLLRKTLRYLADRLWD